MAGSFPKPTEGRVVAFSEVEQTTFNGGHLGGMVLVNNVVTQLNAIENKLNSLLGKYNAHIHVTTATVSTGAPGIINPTTSQESGTITPTTAPDIENDKIKQ